MARGGVRREFLIDANALIDYLDADISILTLFSRHIGKIHVPESIIRDEIEQLSTDEARRYGIHLLEPELEQIEEAGLMAGRASFYDYLLMITARDNGFTCITNDKVLRRLCSDNDITVIWGLEPMIALVQKRKLSRGRALKVALQIEEINPLYITEEIISRFKKRISLDR